MKWWYLLIAPVGALGLFITLDWVRYGYPYLMGVISSWSVLVLAIFAFLAIWVSNEQTRQHRKDEEAKERRERKERLLNEILEWAIDVAKCESEKGISVKPPLPSQVGLGAEYGKYFRNVERANLKLRYQTIDAKSEYIKILSKEFDKVFNEKLHGIVKLTIAKLDTHLILLKECIIGKVTDKECENNWRVLIKRALALTRQVAKIKTKDIA